MSAFDDEVLARLDAIAFDSIDGMAVYRSRRREADEAREAGPPPQVEAQMRRYLELRRRADQQAALPQAARLTALALECAVDAELELARSGDADTVHESSWERLAALRDTLGRLHARLCGELRELGPSPTAVDFEASVLRTIANL